MKLIKRIMISLITLSTCMITLLRKYSNTEERSWSKCTVMRLSKNVLHVLSTLVF